MHFVKIKNIILYSAVLHITIMMIVFPDKSVFFARRAVEICADIVIPSLLPFFVCSGILIYSGLPGVIAKICRPIMKPLFNVSGCGASALVLGIISGYPLGAVTACKLYDLGYLSKSEAERLLAFSNCSGPLFIMGAVGSAIYSDGKIGMMLYISHIAAALSVGILFRFYALSKHNAPTYEINSRELDFSEIFSEAIKSSVKSILTVCTSVIFFSVVSGIITAELPVSDSLQALICGLIELTGGTKAISETSLALTEKLVLSAFIVGFAGICVHMQVISEVSKYHLNLFPYFLGKFLHGIISAAYTFVYLKLFPRDILVFANSSAASAGFCMSSLYSAVGIVFLFTLAAFVFLFGMFAAGERSGAI